MEIFVTILKRVVKWAKNNRLQHVPAFVFILKWEKKTKLKFRNHIIYLFFNKPPQKDEMRWKGNLAFNNDDGKKLYINYLHKKNK